MFLAVSLIYADSTICCFQIEQAKDEQISVSIPSRDAHLDMY